jgi:hypothetical protein
MKTGFSNCLGTTLKQLKEGSGKTNCRYYLTSKNGQKIFENFGHFKNISKMFGRNFCPLKSTEKFYGK